MCDCAIAVPLGELSGQDHTACAFGWIMSPAELRHLGHGQGAGGRGPTLLRRIAHNTQQGTLPDLTRKKIPDPFRAGVEHVGAQGILHIHSHLDLHGRQFANRGDRDVTQPAASSGHGRQGGG